MNILITGATGFIGSYLVPELIKVNHKVRILARNVEKAKELFRDYPCEIVYGDIAKKESLSGCCEEIDIVYNLAALMGHDAPSEKAFERFMKVNLEGVKYLVAEAKRAKVKRFIHISSTAALGLQKVTIVSEKTECNPYTPYQVSKREAEIYLMKEYEQNHFPVVIIRPSMVYGPGFKGDFLTMAKVCMTGFFPKIGRGDNLSPALYITDLIKALLLFKDKGKEGEMYMLSSKQSYTLSETAGIIGETLGKHIIYIYVPRHMAIMGADFLEKVCRIMGKKPPVTKRNIQSVSTDRIIDLAKSRNELGFVPQVSLQEGLPKTIQYFKDMQYI